MIKIYNGNETNFDGTELADIDVLTASVKHKVNGLHSLTFTLPISYATYIEKDRIVKADEQFYRIQRIMKTGNYKEIVKIYAESLIYVDLMDDFSASFVFENISVQQALQQLLMSTVFTMGSCDDLGNKNISIENKNKLQILNEILTIYNGEVDIKALSIGIKSSIGENRGVKFKKGKNLKSIESEEDISNVITRLNYENKDKTLTGTLDSPYINSYANIKNEYKEFDTQTQEELDALAYNYLYQNHEPYINYKVDFADLYYTEEYASVKDLEKVDIGDTVIVEHDNFEININARIVELERDIIEHKNTKVVLGNFRKNYIDMQVKVVERIEKLENASKPDAIIEVVKEQVVSVETAHILNAWIKNLFVDYLETNFSGTDARNNQFENVRNYITIKDQNIKFITQELSDTEIEALTIPNPNGDGSFVNVYYTAIDSHPDAYKYYTITNPKSIYPNLTDEDVSEFEVKVHRSISELVKAEFSFIDEGDGTKIPMLVMGAGDGVSDTSGKSFIKKELDGVSWNYYSRNTDELRQIRLCDQGIFFNPYQMGVVYDVNEEDLNITLSQTTRTLNVAMGQTAHIFLHVSLTVNALANCSLNMVFKLDNEEINSPSFQIPSGINSLSYTIPLFGVKEGEHALQLDITSTENATISKGNCIYYAQSLGIAEEKITFKTPTLTWQRLYYSDFGYTNYEGETKINVYDNGDAQIAVYYAKTPYISYYNKTTKQWTVVDCAWWKYGQPEILWAGDGVFLAKITGMANIISSFDGITWNNAGYCSGAKNAMTTGTYDSSNSCGVVSWWYYKSPLYYSNDSLTERTEWTLVGDDGSSVPFFKYLTSHKGLFVGVVGGNKEIATASSVSPDVWTTTIVEDENETEYMYIRSIHGKLFVMKYRYVSGTYYVNLCVMNDSATSLTETNLSHVGDLADNHTASPQNIIWMDEWGKFVIFNEGMIYVSEDGITWEGTQQLGFTTGQYETFGGAIYIDGDGFYVKSNGYVYHASL